MICLGFYRASRGRWRMRRARSCFRRPAKQIDDHGIFDRPEIGVEETDGA